MVLTFNYEDFHTALAAQAFKFQGKGKSYFDKNKTTGAASSTARGLGMSADKEPFSLCKVCQICGRSNHTTIDCWQRDNFTQHPNKKPRRRVCSTQQISSSSADKKWIFCSGANAHVGGDFHGFTTYQPYNRGNSVSVGNGSMLNIANTGTGIVQTPHTALRQSHILHVLSISHNLLSVCQLTTDNDVSLLFNAKEVLLLDNKTN